MTRSDAVVVTTMVAVDPDSAFEVFTAEIDSWWRRDSRYRFSGEQRMRFEPGEGGRLLAERESGDPREIGRVLVWKPPDRLVFEWRARSFASDERTEVEVRFEVAEGGTRVTLEHRGLEALAPDHPARHGLSGEAFRSMFGLWWGDLLVSLRARAAGRGKRRDSS